MAQKTAPLSPLFLPQKVQLLLPTAEDLLDNLEAELMGAARQTNGWQVRKLEDQPLLDEVSTLCRRFIEDVPELEWASKTLRCQFLRLSVAGQPASAYHLAASGDRQQRVTVASVNKRLIWKLLINLSSVHHARLNFLNVDPFSLSLQVGERSLFCDAGQLHSFMRHKASIPLRDGIAVHGLLFCASRVLHSDAFDKQEQFIAGFGCEEALAL